MPTKAATHGIDRNSIGRLETSFQMWWRREDDELVADFDAPDESAILLVVLVPLTTAWMPQLRRPGKKEMTGDARRAPDVDDGPAIQRW